MQNICQTLWMHTACTICVIKLLLKAYNFSTFQDNHLIIGTAPQTDHNFDRYIVKLLILFMKQLNTNVLFIQIL